MVVALMLLLYAAANIFMLRRGMLWIHRLSLPGYRAVAWVFVGAYLIISALPIIGALLTPQLAASILRRAGNLWLGFCFYLLLAALPLEGIALLRRHGRAVSTAHHSAFSLWGGVAVLLLATALVTYGVFHALEIKSVSYNVTAGKASPGDKAPLTIAFAADLHLGCQIGCSQMEKMVAEINAMDADVILLGGDIFDSDYDMLDDPQGLIEILSGLKSRYGVYGVYGNHDVSETLIGGFSITPRRRALRDPRMEEFLALCGIHMLEDEAVSIAGGRLCVVGRLDGEKAGDGTKCRLPADKLMALADQAAAVIVLEHEPFELAALSALGADLVLGGHTHDGQFFPLNLAQKLIWDNPRGLRKYGDMTSIVTSGVGLYGPPMRVMTTGEVVRITLAFSE